MLRLFNRPVLRLFVSQVLRVLLVFALFLQCAYLGLRTYHNRFIVPVALIHKINNKLIPYGLRFQVKEATLDLRGGVLSLESPSLSLANSKELLMEAGQIDIDLSLGHLLMGRMGIHGVGVENASLYCPALYSPSGQRELLIGKVSGHCRGDHHEWRMDPVMARIGNLSLIMQGEGKLFSWKKKMKGQDRVTSIHKGYKQFCDQVFKLAAFAKVATNSIMEIDFGNTPDGSMRIDFKIGCNHYGIPDEVQLSKFWSKGSVVFDDTWVLEKPLLCHAQSVERSGLFRAGPSWFVLSFGPEAAPENAIGYLTEVEAYGSTWGNLYSELTLSELPKLDGLLRVSQESKWIDFKGKIDLEDESAQGTLRGTYRPEDLYEQIALLQKWGFLEQSRFEDTCRWEADFALGPKWTFESMDLVLRTGAASILGIELNATNVQVKATPEKLDIQQALLWTPRYTVGGSYEHDWETKDYRFLLKGSIDPTVLSPLLPQWWDDLWSEFTFGEVLPGANIDIQGRWGDPQKRFVLGKAHGQDFVFRGVPIAQCRLNLYAVPLYLSIHDLYLSNSGGTVQGDLEWLYKKQDSFAYAVTFDAQGAFRLQEINQLLGGGLAQTVEPFECSTAPYIIAKGYFFGGGSPYSGQTFATVEGDIAQPFAYYNIPLESLRFKAVHTPQETQLSKLEGVFSGGDLQGTMHVKHQKDNSALTFDLNINGASYAKATASLSDVAAFKNVGGQPSDKLKKAKKKQDAGEGLLDISLKGSGQMGALENFEGVGSFHLYEASLGKIRLFGLLSHLLEVPLFGIGSFALNELESEFEFEKGVLNMPHLKVWGPTAKMEGSGYYDLLTDGVNFEINFYLLDQLKIPFVSQALHLIKPVTNVLQASLSGTLEEPVWVPVINPFNVFKPRVPKGPQKALHSRLALP